MVARQAPLSVRFFRQEHWSALPFPSPGFLPDPGTEPMSPVFPALQADSLPSEPLMTEVALFIPLNYLVQCNPPISCVSRLSQPLLILHEGKKCEWGGGRSEDGEGGKSLKKKQQRKLKKPRDPDPIRADRKKHLLADSISVLRVPRLMQFSFEGCFTAANGMFLTESCFLVHLKKP